MVLGYEIAYFLELFPAIEIHFLPKFFHFPKGFYRFSVKIVFRRTNFRGRYPKTGKLVPYKVVMHKNIEILWNDKVLRTSEGDNLIY